jgi:serine/threonine-protein kinase RsbW
VDHAHRPARLNGPSQNPGQTPNGWPAGQPPIGRLAGQPSIGRLAGQSPIGRLADHQLELRLDADPFWMAPLRAFTSDIAARADFDLDAVADLTLAVDEACAALVGAAAPRDTLVCRFAVGTDHITVTATLPGCWPQERLLPDDGIGWRILTTLADDVQLLDELPAPGIRLTKHRAPSGG